jgi:preprotein translocase subunit SecG
MYEILLIVYLLVALCLVFLILIQQGKGADMGASFGAGSSNTLFGASGSGSFLTKSTTTLAISFFVLSIALGNMSNNQAKQVDEFSDLGIPGGAVSEQPQAEDVPQNDKVIPGSNVPATDVPAGDMPVPTQEDKSDVPAGN